MSSFSLVPKGWRKYYRSWSFIHCVPRLELGNERIYVVIFIVFLACNDRFGGEVTKPDTVLAGSQGLLGNPIGEAPASNHGERHMPRSRYTIWHAQGLVEYAVR